LKEEHNSYYFEAFSSALPYSFAFLIISFTSDLGVRSKFIFLLALFLTSFDYKFGEMEVAFEVLRAPIDCPNSESFSV
jgi:hypothetical protein